MSGEVLDICRVCVQLSRNFKIYVLDNVMLCAFSNSLPSEMTITQEFILIALFLSLSCTLSLSLYLNVIFIYSVLPAKEKVIAEEYRDSGDALPRSHSFSDHSLPLFYTSRCSGLLPSSCRDFVP